MNKLIESGWRRAVGAVRRLTRCAVTDVRMAAELGAWRLSLPVLKRTVNMPTLARVMWSTAASTDARERQMRVARVLRLIADGGRLLVSSNCLERSLVLYRFLSRAGANPKLVLGAARDGASIAGHAWIELDGEPLEEADAASYAPVVIFGSGGRRIDAEAHALA